MLYIILKIQLKIYIIYLMIIILMILLIIILLLQVIKLLMIKMFYKQLMRPMKKLNI